jgi:FlaA1/EpsC-like NDP-sugar epimerase
MSAPRIIKWLVAVLVDVSLCLLSVWLAFYLRLGEQADLFKDDVWRPEVAFYVSVAIALPIFIVSGFYRAVFRHTGSQAMMTIARATLAYGTVFATIFMLVGVDGVPRTIGLMQPILLLVGLGGSRALARLWLGDGIKRAVHRKVLIYGSGVAGRRLASALNGSEMLIVGFLDDDSQLHGRVINGIPIFNPVNLPELISKHGVRDVLLALPSGSKQRRKQIIDQMHGLKIAVRTLPGLSELAEGKVHVSDIRELDIDDLLGREAAVPDSILLNKNVNNKVVLVTGAGGSIGSELCRQVIRLNPTKLVLIEQNEFALYSLQQELFDKHPAQSECLVALLASTLDAPRIATIMATWNPDIVFHAAAYKHVPLVEHNLAEGVRNNVFGTLAVVKAAIAARVSDFVLVSTDKAVRPTNVMGASKRLAELVLQALSKNQEIETTVSTQRTTLSMVRFGNVLGSSGSVVPKFWEQIKTGGPITITHSEITRFFMTATEAAQLVIQACALANGGEVFVLDMHHPVKIKDLALRMIQLSGLTLRDENNPNGDIAIVTTGLRPGEKLYEELLIGNNPEVTSHPRIMKAREDFVNWNILEKQLSQLESALVTNDAASIRDLMQDMVAGYEPQGPIVDLVFVEQFKKKSIQAN